MDTVKKAILAQQAVDNFRIQKSIIGTEEYYIDQDIQKGVSQDEIIEKAKSGVYKLTAENKKAGRVGQKYGESKKEDDKQNDATLRDLETKLNYAKDFSPHKVDYYNELIKEHKEKSNPKESTEKKEEGFKIGDKVKDKTHPKSPSIKILHIFKDDKKAIGRYVINGIEHEDEFKFSDLEKI